MNRRDFVKSIAAAGAGLGAAGTFTYDALAQAARGAAPKRREVFIGRKRIKGGRDQKHGRRRHESPPREMTLDRARRRAAQHEQQRPNRSDG